MSLVPLQIVSFKEQSKASLSKPLIPDPEKTITLKLLQNHNWMR